MSYSEQVKNFNLANEATNLAIKENELHYNIFLAHSFYTVGVAYLGTTVDFIDYPIADLFYTYRDNGFNELKKEINVSGLSEQKQTRLLNLINSYPIHDYIPKPVINLNTFEKTITDKQRAKAINSKTIIPGAGDDL
jgi:hypothetical protein